ncbi:DUF4190 domain-containing protein [Streptomyces axinellae]|uniref:DUF4190 domain-containing protein n=1 Tax=Streptomyces axinellae TaxID=552788 RepID=A0ABN3QPY4_9ACTN
MDDGAGHPPPSGGPGRQDDQQRGQGQIPGRGHVQGSWAAGPSPNGQAGSPGGAGPEQPPPIPLAPDGPAQPYPGQPGYGGPYGFGHGHGPSVPEAGSGPGAVPGAGPAAGPYGTPPGHPGAPGQAAYGAGAYASHGYGWQGPPPPVGKSVSAMVVGIVSVVLIVTCWGSFLSVLTSTVALFLGISARRGVRAGQLGGRGQATAGFVLGIVGLVGSVVVSALLVVLLATGSDEPGGGGPGPGPGSGPSRDDGDSYDAKVSVPTIPGSVAPLGSRAGGKQVGGRQPGGNTAEVL